MKRVLIIAAMLLSAVFAGAQEIRSIDIDVYINDEGDAYVKQRWDVNVVSGTEWYIPIGNLPAGNIRRLSVEENGEQFIDDGREWDSSRSRSEKAGHCGIVVKGSDEVELCWGQGEMGDHKWTAGFVVLDLVNALEDYDAFNFMFVNPGLIAPPKHASIRFSRLSGKPFPADSTRFWFFGCEGDSGLCEDGTIFFETDRAMPSNGSLIAMMRFDKGVFRPDKTVDMKFEKMQKKAFKGSTYAKRSWPSFEDILTYIAGGLMVLAVVLAVLMALFFIFRDIVLRISGRIWDPKVFGSARPRDWAREAPFGGSIPVASHLLSNGSRLMFGSKHPERRIGAYFLKWISEGVVTPVKSKGGHYDLVFPEKAPEFEDKCEAQLYAKSLEAAGSNRILENGEFKAWSEKHYGKLVNWPESVAKEGKAQLATFTGDKQEESRKLLEFKNFLSGFTLSREREVPEVSLWGQYLVFAQLFGIADKVSAGLAKLYPNEFAAFSEARGMDPSAMNTVIHYWTTDTVRSYRAAYDKKISNEASSSSRSSSGFGGHSSFGGGGGFSGGGFGGGSR